MFDFFQIWNLIATISYLWTYKINEFESDSVQYIIVLIPFIKGIQMAMALLCFSFCYSDSLVSLTLQKYVLMLLLATETVSRTCIATIIYLIASVSLPFFDLLTFFTFCCFLTCIAGLGNFKVLFRF
jgi:hypothetical protein